MTKIAFLFLLPFFALVHLTLHQAIVARMRECILIILVNTATAFVSRSHSQKLWTRNIKIWGKASGKRKQLVPLLGPIPGEPPLILGGELILDCPTPLQWQALEESVLVHQQFLEEQAQSTDTDITVSEDAIKTCGVDAAPIVAVIDEITGTRRYE